MRRFLGVNGVNSLSRTMEFLLICIRAQFAIDGVRDLALDAALWQQWVASIVHSLWMEK